MFFRVTGMDASPTASGRHLRLNGFLDLIDDNTRGSRTGTTAPARYPSAMRPELAKSVLKWLLLVLGAIAASAVVAMVMPFTWMQVGNDWLGLAPLDNTPLIQYLTRSLSAVYALFGVLAIYVAFDVRHYRKLLVLMGWLTAILGVALTAIDFTAGMPVSWSWAEGPPTVVLGVLIVWLARHVSSD